nr:hypothetical protein OH826_19485 [Streptomyces sp. NBC_00899]
MIADLLARELSPHRWGTKAARLSQAARHRAAAVPQGLCLETAPHAQPDDHVRTALAQWLRARRPPLVIVRSSSRSEDGGSNSAAGRLLTLRDVTPDATSVLEAAQHVATSVNEAGGGSVIIQHQLPAELMGVAFTQTDGSVLVEGSTIAAAVTDGQPPQFLMTIRPDRCSVEGDLRTVPPVVLAGYLHDLADRLAQIFPFALDIEWATVAGHPFLVQVRPVTAAVGAAR